jgi:hypothetical protein
MRSVRKAGIAPATKIARQPEFLSNASTHGSGRNDSSSPSPSTKRATPSATKPTSMNPTLAAAPMRPAMSGRDRLGHTSATSATPSAHSPPMPIEATNRRTASCIGVSTRAHSPENTE